MAATDLLDQLRDIHTPQAPPDVSYLPLLAIAAALLCLLGLAAILFSRTRGSWRSEAAHRLSALAGAPPEVSLAGAAVILRQIALLRAGVQATKLTGESWLAELDRLLRTDYFTAGRGRIFADGIYRPADDAAKSEAVIADLRRLVHRQRFRPW